MAVRFGRSQLRNPTPSQLSGWVKACTVVFGIIITWLPSAPFIGHVVASDCQSILGLLVAIGNGVLPFFGVETTQKNIAIEDVSEMENKKDS